LRNARAGSRTGRRIPVQGTLPLGNILDPGIFYHQARRFEGWGADGEYQQRTMTEIQKDRQELSRREFKQQIVLTLENRMENLEEEASNLKNLIKLSDTPGRIRTAVAGSKVLHD
jgi:hypothetical protein